MKDTSRPLDPASQPTTATITADPPAPVELPPVAPETARGAMVPTRDASPSAARSEDFDIDARALEALVAKRRKLVGILATCFGRRVWVLHASKSGPTPDDAAYLMGKPASVVLRWHGVFFRAKRIVRHEPRNPGPAYFTCHAEAWRVPEGGGPAMLLGEFFGSKAMEGYTEAEDDARKGAETNLCQRAATMMFFGIVTRADLDEWRVEATGEVTYNTGARGGKGAGGAPARGATAPPRPQPAPPPEGSTSGRGGRRNDGPARLTAKFDGVCRCGCAVAAGAAVAYVKGQGIIGCHRCEFTGEHDVAVPAQPPDNLPGADGPPPLTDDDIPF